MLERRVLARFELDAAARGRRELLLRQLTRRLGDLSPADWQALDALPPERLPDLANAVFDFTAAADLRAWLTAHRKAAE
jgi:heme oxygenase